MDAPHSPTINSPCIYDISFRVEVKPYSSKELCIIYGITKKTFLNWLEPFHKDIGLRKGRFYSIIQVHTIFLKLGVPYVIRERS